MTVIHLLSDDFFKNGETYFRLILSTLLGIFIGWNRSSKNKPAGVKTYMYVCVSCTLITVLSIESAELFSEEGTGKVMDPMRLTAQIISGLGFLGAGIIMKEGFQVKGLTSAAMLFFAGGVGIGIGIGLYSVVVFAIMTTFSALKIEKIYKKRRISKNENVEKIERERELL